MNDFQEFLRAARARAKLSQSKFAVALKIGLRTLQSWEIGYRRPNALAEGEIRRRIKDFFAKS